MTETEPLLKIDNIKVRFDTYNGNVSAVDGVSLQLNAGEVLGIVGESGCGKSVTAEAILQLLDPQHTNYEGQINFQGKNLLDLKENEMNAVRGNDISMIFQDPMSTLNPVIPIGKQIAKAIRIHQHMSKKEAATKAIEMLHLTGIPSPEKRSKEYPHELSGGMRQRVVIAMALACQPQLLIADEPTTALDVTIQAQILELIKQFQKEWNTGTILITHDFGVVAQCYTKVAVMYLGQVIEETDVQQLFTNPLHPYTKGLMHSVPKLDGDRSQDLPTISGVVPSLSEIPIGCRFAPRCPYATKQCTEEMPKLEEKNTQHIVRCWHTQNIEKGEVFYA